MQLVITYNEQATTTLILVAQKFGKEHKNVLATINGLECTTEFRRLNFKPSNYETRGKSYPMYIITRDGFTMLMMSFTGSPAAKFREEFIDEFNRMEKVLRLGRTPVLIPTYQTRIMSEPTKSCPDSHFTVFDASHNIMLFIEVNIGSINKYDLVDGSIGIHWSKYRENADWALPAGNYIHQYRDERGPRICKCYRNEELEHFKKWLKNIYQPFSLFPYLSNKYSKEKNQVMIDKVNEIMPKLISNF